MVVTPDEMQVLWPPTWEGLQQQIVYLAQFGNSVQVIHGEAESGKTTFFNRLLQRDFGQSAIGVKAEDGGGLESFFRSILTQIGLRPDVHATRGELIAALRGFVQTLHKERSRAVLLIDDAHLLTDSELGALVSLLQGQADAGVGMHVVMFAEPGFAARLDALDLLDVEVQDAPLPPFSPAEVQSLLRTLASDMGFVLEPPDQAQRLWHQSRGLPGKVYNLAQQLKPAPAEDKTLSLRGLPIGHFAALVLLSGVLIWAFLVREPEQAPLPEAKPLVVPALDPPTAEPEPAPPAMPSGSAPDADTAPAQVPAVTEIAAPAAAAPEITLPAPPVPDTSPKAGANFDAQVPDASPATQPATKTEPAAVPRPVDKPAAPEKVSTPTKGVDPWSATERELLRLPGTGFVLQLMATSTDEALKSYVAQQPNRKNLRMYRGVRNGKTLYIVVEGFYADKAAAQAAVVNLPEHQRRAGPWPKSLEQIHREIKTNQLR